MPHRNIRSRRLTTAAAISIVAGSLFSTAAMAGDNTASQHAPTVAPSDGVRRGGSLVVADPPQQPSDRAFVPRMRAHVEGSLTADSERVWVGPPVPRSVAIEVDGRELFLLDPVEGGHVALYRDPYGGKSCTLGGRENCRFLARFYADDEETPRWSVDLGPLMSGPRNLELQDLRYADGVLYFNDACASYSVQAKGKCSSLIAWDSATQKVLWRTKPLTSNGRFLVYGELLISGYGFTDEPDWVFLVSRKDGRVLAKRRLKKAHETLSVEGDVLEVGVYDSPPKRFRLVGLDGKRPRMQPIR